MVLYWNYLRVHALRVWHNSSVTRRLGRLNHVVAPIQQCSSITLYTYISFTSSWHSRSK